MPWHEITFDTPDTLKDAVIGELTELGAAGVWESGDEQITAYFETVPDFQAVKNLFERDGVPVPVFAVAPVKDRDWGEEWKKTWTSFPLGTRFFVIPSWLDTPCPEGRFPILIDPGQAFGTGTHESTQLTLEAMERFMQPGQSDDAIFDLGTGSGILAIAATLLGAKNVSGSDNDPIAIEVAQENTARNAAGHIRLAVGSLESVNDHSVDLLLCNLTADVITALYDEIDRVLRPEGIAIFSGVLNFQAPGILQLASAHGHTLLEHTQRGEWSGLVVRHAHGR